ncbi:MAG: aconitase X swivel domain-containing protein [Thermoproteus sp.]|jgi:predicted aconitase with swiveling domain
MPTLRPIVKGAGVVRTEVVRLGPISFLGDLNPESGEISGVKISGKILAVPYVRGSTVGPYVLWHAAARGNAPLAIVAKSVDLMLITASVLADVPLFQGELSEECIEIDLSTGRYERCR